VYTNVSNFALGIMLGQNLDNTIEKPIYYASRLLNNVLKNYNTIEKETLAVIYALKKIRHYLLGNNIVFYVDCQTSLYLVNKLVVIGQIVRWLLFLRNFDFKVVYKPN
jgi:hypothetical protein